MKKLILIAAIALIPALLAACSDTDPASSVESLKGKPAPNFTLKSLDGQDLTLSAEKGKVVLIDTWATWCPPCRESLPHIQKVAADKSLADKGLIVWAVNDAEEKNTVAKFLADNKYTFTALIDSKADVLRQYKVEGIPTTFIVGRDGTVKAAFIGYNGDSTAKQIDDALNTALAEAPPK